MWTKNGKVRPGTETRMVGLSAAKAGAESAIASRLAVTTRRVKRMDGNPPWSRPDMLAGGAAPCPKSDAATREDRSVFRLVEAGDAFTSSRSPSPLPRRPQCRAKRHRACRHAL